MKFFSLRQIQEVIIEPVTPSIRDDEDCEMKSDDDEKMQDIVENKESLNATSDDEDDGQDEADEKRRAEHAQLV